MKNTLVLVNYSAGRKQAIKYRKMIQKFLMRKSVHFRFVTLDEWYGVDIDEYDTILVVGGDGTVNKVLPSLVDTDKTLGIIPTGTANLLSAKLGISNIKEALSIIDKGETKQIDLISINKNLCVLRFGLGYDADIICKTPQSLKNKFGYFSYFVAGILFALRLKLKEYQLCIDGNEKTVNASCIICANADNMYRNMITISSESKPDDNLMDIFILKTKNPILFFIEFLKLIIGIHKTNSLAEYMQAKEVDIKNNYSLVHIDGEKMKLIEDISIKVLRQQICVFGK